MRSIGKIAVIFLCFFIIAGISAYLTLTFIIKGEETVVVPNLIGEDVVSVLELLTGLGLNTKVKGSQYSASISKNSIIYQEPEPGDLIKKGRDIRIVISKGTRMVAMPNLNGLSLQQARVILDKNGLTQGIISKTTTPLINADSVISQFPVPGTKIERGTQTNMLISIGQRHFASVMPDLAGLFFDEAVLSIEKNKLEINTITAVYQKDKPADIVLSQDPPPGYHVMENSPVDLKVNRKKNQHSLNYGQTFKRGSLFRYKLAPGYLKQHIRLELKTFGITCIVYDELMEPDREIWIFIPSFHTSVLFLYKNNELIKTKIYE